MPFPCIYFIAAAALATITSTDAAALILFFDNTTTTQLDTRLSLRVNRPAITDTPVISPDQPWESWAVFAYNSVLLTPDGLEYRMCKNFPRTPSLLLLLLLLLLSSHSQTRRSALARSLTLSALSPTLPLHPSAPPLRPTRSAPLAPLALPLHCRLRLYRGQRRPSRRRSAR